MSAKQRGLGRGLGALIGDFPEEPESGAVTKLPLQKVEPNPDQPRRTFDEEELQALADSIAAHGILQPLAVRASGDGFYQIIAGERRWRAARMAGLSEVPVVVLEADDRTVMELALVENLQRQDLNPMEEAEGYQRLMKEYGLTQEEAKNHLLKNLENECKHDAALKIKEIETNLKDNADQLAREIISIAIQRCAADHAAETTVSVVALPNDEMKGRIIGREGRNIRTLEAITGVDLIIDDTPEAITVSCFDPVRREVARLALEKLIADGRIHPTRIEDLVEKARKEVDRVIKQEGERATFETGINNLHPELIKLLGRQKYRTSYGQNVLNHSIEVAHIAGLLASELGVDVALAKRAGLLHDLGKSVDHEMEGSHVQLGVELARKYNESPDVIHAIEAHHNDVEPRTVIACLVQAADAISAARPGARRENVENYIRRLEKLEELTGTYPGVEKSYAIQAGREVRIMVKPEDVSEDNMIILARELTKKIESELEYPGQIKVNVIRETKVVEYAK